MSSSTTGITLNRQKLYCQTLGILNTNSLHFITISLMFIPLTFSAFSTIQFYVSSRTDNNTEFESFNLFLLKTILKNLEDQLILKELRRVLTFTFSVIIPTATGMSLIIYITHQRIHNKPVTFSSTIKSLSNSYMHVLYAIILGAIKLIRNAFLLAISPLLLTASIKGMGFHFDFQFANIIGSYIIALNIIYFIVIWGSAVPIAVLNPESHFNDFVPLDHSANQSAEFRWLSLNTLFLTGFAIGPALTYSAVHIGSATTWISTLQVCATYLQSSLVILFYVVANTVLYVQYKAARGEDIGETTVEGEREVSDGYVSLTVDEKNDDVPAKKGANGGFSYMIFLTIFWVILLFPILQKIYNF